MTPEGEGWHLWFRGSLHPLTFFSLIEPRGSHPPGKQATTGPHPQPFLCDFIPPHATLKPGRPAPATLSPVSEGLSLPAFALPFVIFIHSLLLSITNEAKLSFWEARVPAFTGHMIYTEARLCSKASDEGLGPEEFALLCLIQEGFLEEVAVAA